MQIVDYMKISLLKETRESMPALRNDGEILFVRGRLTTPT